MDNLPVRIGEFIGASVICAPLTLALIWFIRWTVKGADWPHWYKTLFSCGVVSGLFLALSLMSRNAGNFEGWGFLILQECWVLVWFVVGLFAWRPRPKNQAKS
jgi:hypothetical protein